MTTQDRIVEGRFGRPGAATGTRGAKHGGGGWAALRASWCVWMACLIVAGCAGGLRTSTTAVGDGRYVRVVEYRTTRNAGSGMESVVVIALLCDEGPGRVRLDGQTRVEIWDQDLEQWRHHEIPDQPLANCVPLHQEPIVVGGRTLIAGMFDGAGTALVGGGLLVWAADRLRPDTTEMTEHQTFTNVQDQGQGQGQGQQQEAVSQSHSAAQAASESTSSASSRSQASAPTSVSAGASVQPPARRPTRHTRYRH